MSLLPASETESLLLPAERDEIGTFAERARDFAAQASVAGEGGVDEVWVVCRHVTPSWAARSIWIDRYAAERVCGGIVHIEAEPMAGTVHVIGLVGFDFDEAVDVAGQQFEIDHALRQHA